MSIEAGQILFENLNYQISYSGNINEYKIYSIKIQSINKYYSYLNYNDNYDLNDLSITHALSQQLITKFENENFVSNIRTNSHIIVNTENDVDKVRLFGNLNNIFHTSWGIYNSQTNNFNLKLNLNESDFIDRSTGSLHANLQIKINNIKILFFEDVIDEPISHSNIELNLSDRENWVNNQRVEYGLTVANCEEWWHGFLDATSILRYGGSQGSLISNIFNKYATFNENSSSGIQNIITLSPINNSFMPVQEIYQKTFSFIWNAGARATSLLGNKSHISLLGAALDINYDLKWDDYNR